VAPLIQKAGSRETGRGTADGRDGNPGVEEAAGRRAECSPTPGIPHVGTRQDEQVAVRGFEILEKHVRHDAEPAHGGDRLASLGNCHDVPPTTGETTGTELDQKITDLPVGKGVVQAQMCS
jgi:hypothetical protein